ncbi:MAG: HEAT repeat domain-containing protein [Planctomycetota bacterium]|jgi:HEAT repeat protein
MKTYIVNKILLTGFILLAACTARAADEKDLIAILRSDASVSAKCAACQQLRIYGSAKSIPDLAALLTEENLSHAARYALEGLQYPEAGAALRSALDKTTGRIKAGLIDSLGWRRDMASVPLIVPLLSDTNVALAATTASALGKIGSDDAVVALIAARDNSHPEVKTAILDALLLCAENHLSSGKKDDAVSLYRDLFQSKVPGSIRIAAWRGWMLSDSIQRRNHIPKVLTGSDTNMRVAAIKIIRELKDRQLIVTCLQHWKSLPAPAQLAVLDAHLQFGSEALPTVRTASESPHLEVRAAAWRALGDLSDASLIPAAVRAAAHAESIERNAAREALTRMRGLNVRPALLNYLKKAKSSEKAELLRTLGQRGDAAATSILLKNAAVDEDIVKLAALDSLRSLAVPETLEPLLKIAAVSKTRTQRTAALKALYAVCRKCPDIKLTSRQIITAIQSFSKTELYNVLPLLSQLATPEALTVVQKATQDSDVQLARESLRVLTLWPNATPVQFLFDLARTNSNPTVQTVALRGGITVAGRETDPSTRLVMLRKALTLAKRTEEKIMVLSQLSRISTPESLNMAIEHLKNPSLVNEAGLAAVSIAESLAGGNPKLADEAARKILEHCKLQAVVSRAWALRIKTPASGPFIRDWLVSELYRQPSVTGALAIFNIKFGPEKPQNTVKWYAAPVGDTMQLASYFPGQTDCVAYLKAEIIAPNATDAILLMGSDDGIKAWLNGTVVHSNNIDRGQVVDQDIAPIKLKQGANELLLKITQGGGGWSACARIVGADNFPIEGLRITSQTDKAPPISAYKPAPVSAPVLKEATLPK